MTRDRAQTETRILDAVGALLAEPPGFRGLGINAIAERAAVDKVLIYRYFGGLPEVLTAYGAAADLWPSVDEVLGGHDPTKEGFVAALSALVQGYLAALQRRPATLEVLAWSMCERNPLTEAMERARAAWERDVTDRVFRHHKVPARVDIQAVLAVLAAAADGLAARARTSDRYNGVELNTADGRRRLNDAIALIVESIIAFATQPADSRRKA
jgi:AcrR family transcriptional regulator